MVPKPDSLVNAGHAVKQEVSRYRAKSGSASHINLFYKDAKQILRSLYKHFMKSPLKHTVVRLSIVFNPCYMANNFEACIQKFSMLLQKFLSVNRIPSSIFAEQCESQYSKFLNEVVAVNKLQFLMFNKFNDRLDDFLASMLNNKDYAALYYVFQIICVLFHGQAAVETGFSVNKGYLVVNLQEESLGTTFRIYDHMNENNETAANISITNELLKDTCAG